MPPHRRSRAARGRLPGPDSGRELSIGSLVNHPHAGTCNQELAMRTPWLGALAACVGLGLGASIGLAQEQSPQEQGEQPFKQVRLTEKHVKGYISAQKELAPLASRLEGAGDKLDPALQSELQKIAKNNGFSTLDELGEVGANISWVLAGLDPETGRFTEPPDLIRKGMVDIKQDTKMSKEDKDQALSEMQEALKSAAPLQFKENVTLVKRYRKELDQAIGQDEPATEQQEPAKK
jgi:hypothetical protein